VADVLVVGRGVLACRNMPARSLPA
jgi:hypothetical protein